MVSTVADEEAPACTGTNDAHGHDGNAGCDKDPRDFGADPHRRQRALVVQPVPALRGLRGRPHARERAAPVRAAAVRGRLLGRLALVGDQHLGGGRLAPADAAGRADGQPRRHAVVLRDAARPRLSPARARGRAARAPSRTPPSARSTAPSPTTTRRPTRPAALFSTAPRARPRTATPSCCCSTRAGGRPTCGAGCAPAGCPTAAWPVAGSEPPGWECSGGPTGGRSRASAAAGARSTASASWAAVCIGWATRCAGCCGGCPHVRDAGCAGGPCWP